MATPNREEKDDKQAPNNSAVGWTGMIEQQYRKVKENAEAYPYVWGSYIVVYGGFGILIARTWWKLRKTEDRVRALHNSLRKKYEAEASASSAATAGTDKAPADKGTPNSTSSAATAGTDKAPADKGTPK